MELMTIKFPFSLGVPACLIKQCYLFKNKIVTLLYQIRIILQECQTFSMRTLQFLIKLIQFHKNTRISFVQEESTFHTLKSPFGSITLVIIDKGKITPSGRELRIKFGSTFPMVLCKVILTLVIEKVAKIVIGASIIEIDFKCSIQSEYCLKTVREHIVRTIGTAGIESLSGIFFIACLQQAPPKIIICHRSSSLLCYGNLPKRLCLFPQAGSTEIKSNFVIIMRIAMCQ